MLTHKSHPNQIGIRETLTIPWWPLSNHCRQGSQRWWDFNHSKTRHCQLAVSVISWAPGKPNGKILLIFITIKLIVLGPTEKAQVPNCQGILSDILGSSHQGCNSNTCPDFRELMLFCKTGTMNDTRKCITYNYPKANWKLFWEGSYKNM